MNDDEKKKLMKLALEKRRQEILDKKQKDFVRRGQADLKSKNFLILTVNITTCQNTKA